jgi:hypothetical protein
MTTVCTTNNNLRYLRKKICGNLREYFNTLNSFRDQRCFPQISADFEEISADERVVLLL